MKYGNKEEAAFAASSFSMIPYINQDVIDYVQLERNKRCCQQVH